MRQAFRYAYGRMETSSDQETIRQLYAAFKNSGFHFKDLVIAIVKAPAFIEGQQKSQVAQNRPGANTIESVRR